MSRVNLPEVRIELRNDSDGVLRTIQNLSPGSKVKRDPGRLKRRLRRISRGCFTLLVISPRTHLQERHQQNRLPNSRGDRHGGRRTHQTHTKNRRDPETE